MALGWIGANLIHQLDGENPQSVEEELCADNFPLAVRTALEEKPWLFATGSKPLDLGVAEETGDARFPVRFALPPEVVAVRYIQDANGYPLEFEKRDGFVVTEDAEKAFAICTTYIDDPKRWTPTFCRAVASQIAADLAPVLAPERAGLDRKMEARYIDAISKAGVFDLGQFSGGKLGKVPGPMARRGR
jgi:hypothetical protein